MFEISDLQHLVLLAFLLFLLAGFTNGDSFVRKTGYRFSDVVIAKAVIVAENAATDFSYHVQTMRQMPRASAQFKFAVVVCRRSIWMKIESDVHTFQEVSTHEVNVEEYLPV
jgi:hypothetical protein